MLPVERSREDTRTLTTLNTHGACVGAEHPDWWFAERGRDDTESAKRVCDACPVRQECCEYALAHGDEQGVWGGLSEDERDEMRACRRAARRVRAPRSRRSVMPGSVMLPGLEHGWGESA